MIGAKLGPYEIAAKPGEGGVGPPGDRRLVEYLARDIKLECNVAMKVPPAASS